MIPFVLTIPAHGDLEKKVHARLLLLAVETFSLIHLYKLVVGLQLSRDVSRQPTPFAHEIRPEILAHQHEHFRHAQEISYALVVQKNQIYAPVSPGYAGHTAARCFYPAQPEPVWAHDFWTHAPGALAVS